MYFTLLGKIALQWTVVLRRGDGDAVAPMNKKHRTENVIKASC